MKINVKQLDINLKECTSIYDRIIGFMFKKKLIDSALLFSNCNAIHTFFMFQPIDVVMADNDDNILYTYKQLPPNKIILPKKNVSRTYELPVGTIDKIYKKN